MKCCTKYMYGISCLMLASALSVTPSTHEGYLNKSKQCWLQIVLSDTYYVLYRFILVEETAIDGRNVYTWQLK